MGEDATEREVAVRAREEEVDRREAALSERLEAAKEILRAADLRDVEADRRDDASVRRDQVADLAEFVRPEGGVPYGSDNPARRHAALDRVSAKDDRAWAADDRDALTEAPTADPVDTSED